MPISSYVINTLPKKKDQVEVFLSKMDHIEVIPSDNKDVFVVVVDTPDIDADKMVERALKDIDGVIDVAFAYGSVEEAVSQPSEDTV
ncbi:MAG: chaperone NapD [Fibrobacterales bacterium]